MCYTTIVKHGTYCYPESPRIKSRSFFFCKKCYNLPVEFEGPPHGEDSVFDTRIEGFNTPWLHTKNHPNGRFLVLGGFMLKFIDMLDEQSLVFICSPCRIGKHSFLLFSLSDACKKKSAKLPSCFFALFLVKKLNIFIVCL